MAFTCQNHQRIRLNNETYAKFDGTNHVVLQNAFTTKALRIQADILLILFELCTWKELGELLAPWPPDDQTKIRNYLAQFYEAEMLLIEGEASASEANLEATAGIAPTSAQTIEAIKNNKVPINVENHLHMLRDYVRMAAYRRAIEQVVTPGCNVLDLGAGSGVLSFLASRAGAAQVVAIEKQSHIVELAKVLAEANEITNVTFINKSSNLVSPDELKLPSLPDVLVAEIIGDGILEENILEYTLDARRRLLKPGATLLPCKLDILAFPFYADAQHHHEWEAAELQDLYGLDFGLLGKVLAAKATLRRERYAMHLFKAMGKPQVIHSLDFRTLEDTTFTAPMPLPLEHDGWVSGVCLFFKAWLTEDVCLTNSPWAPPTHWTQLLYYLPKPEPVTKAHTFDGQLIYDGSLRVSLFTGEQ